MKINRRLITILLIAPLLLLIPFLAMQFSSEINWSFPDFVVMGVLLLGLGLLVELILRHASKNYIRIALIAFALILFILIWSELAVGIFGTPLAGS